MPFLDVACVSIYGSQEHVAKMARRSMVTGAQRKSINVRTERTTMYSLRHSTVKKWDHWKLEDEFLVYLGGGFKDFLCSPLFGEDSHFD